LTFDFFPVCSFHFPIILSLAFIEYNSYGNSRELISRHPQPLATISIPVLVRFRLFYHLVCVETDYGWP